MKIMRALVAVGVLVGAAIWVSSSAGKPPALAPSMKDRMVGTWKLESRVTKMPDGTVTPLAGWDGAVGYIAYDKNGFMTVQFMQLNRTKESGTNAYVAYFGPYTVDENTKIVTHHIIGDINPMGVGGNQPRQVVLEGDNKLSLYISNANSPNININSFTRMK
jgi:hypothetical protein